MSVKKRAANTSVYDSSSLTTSDSEPLNNTSNSNLLIETGDRYSKFEIFSSSPNSSVISTTSSTIPVERLKTICFAGYLLLGFISAIVTLQITNQRVPFRQTILSDEGVNYRVGFLKCQNIDFMFREVFRLGKFKPTGIFIGVFDYHDILKDQSKISKVRGR